jgi:hypothetical protein
MADEHMPPPDGPWERGSHEGYKAFHIVLEICEDALGRVFSSHSFRDQIDEETAFSLRNGGVEQIAFAFLAESLRRELFVDIMVKLSADPAFVEKWRNGDEAAQVEIEREVAHASLSVMTSTLPKLAGALTKEAFSRLTEVP